MSDDGPVTGKKLRKEEIDAGPKAKSDASLNTLHDVRLRMFRKKKAHLWISCHTNISSHDMVIKFYAAILLFQFDLL